jgi:2-phospho-L-lactate guanylyltransferase
VAAARGGYGQSVRAHVLVPVKRLNGKSRLAAILSESEREQLVLDMLRHVLGEANRAAVGPISVVSSERVGIDEVAWLDDGGLPWNTAIAEAIRAAVAPDEIAVVLSADLPRLQATDVQALVAATPERGAAIARAKDGGTNAVAMRPPGALDTVFGEPGSAALHEQAARDAGLEAVLLDRPGLAFDVDTPEDLAAWR